jgi:hypothetical protein
MDYQSMEDRQAIAMQQWREQAAELIRRRWETVDASGGSADDLARASAATVIQRRFWTQFLSRNDARISAYRRDLHDIVTGAAILIQRTFRTHGAWRREQIRAMRIRSRLRWARFVRAVRLVQATYRQRFMSDLTMPPSPPPSPPAGDLCDGCERAHALTLEDAHCCVASRMMSKPPHVHCHQCNVIVRMDGDECPCCGFQVNSGTPVPGFLRYAGIDIGGEFEEALHGQSAPEEPDTPPWALRAALAAVVIQVAWRGLVQRAVRADAAVAVQAAWRQYAMDCHLSQCERRCRCRATGNRTAPREYVFCNFRPCSRELSSRDITCMLCKAVFYCCAEHRQLGWPEHSLRCKVVQRNGGHSSL